MYLALLHFFLFAYLVSYAGICFAEPSARSAVESDTVIRNNGRTAASTKTDRNKDGFDPNWAVLVSLFFLNAP